MTLVSIVVPVYYNTETLPTLLGRFRGIAAEMPDLDFEFVLTDDGSGDDSFAILQREAAEDGRVRALRLSRNFGSNAAILAGLTYARGDCCVIIAADLQDPPELIPDLIRSWQRGNDVVLAARRERDDPFPSSAFAALFNRLFQKTVFPDFPTNGFDFLLISRRVRTLMVEMGERNSYIFGLVMWVGFQRDVLYYDRAARAAGRSRWTLTRKVKYFIDAFTAFSYLPVRAASALGFLLAFVGFGYAALIFVLRLIGLVEAPGFTAIIMVTLVLAGTQLVVTGLIGEYLWRVLEETRKRPMFLVNKTVNVRPPERQDAASRATEVSTAEEIDLDMSRIEAHG
ncbi:MAG: glycosyltransferase family 2 protein [Chloroflexi bacterium]|nr:glycosyltransferase family 2 protein [Chloroflexota bacterium]